MLIFSRKIINIKFLSPDKQKAGYIHQLTEHEEPAACRKSTHCRIRDLLAAVVFSINTMERDANIDTHSEHDQEPEQLVSCTLYREVF